MVTAGLSSLFSLKNKNIVVTGAAGLLGTKHAEAISAYGGRPILLDLSLEKVSSLAKHLNDVYNVGAVGYEVDVTKEDQVKDNVAQIINKYTKVDALVNNAANNPQVKADLNKEFSRLENFSIDAWNEDIAVGLTGAFLCAKHYGNFIALNPDGGSIINISSDLGLIGPDQRLYEEVFQSDTLQPVKPVSYSVIKTGILGLTRYLATYWANKNVRCNAICPGGIRKDQTQLFLDKVSLRIPLGRLAEAEEYQGTLIWMLSGASRYLNGAIVPVDGGRTTW